MSSTTKILKLRPVAKSEEEVERLNNLKFEVPRKFCAQISPEMLRFKDTKKHEQQHRSHILKRIMKIARIHDVDKKMNHILDFDASEKVVPEGEVSKRIYHEIFHTRDFDLYGKLLKPIKQPPRKHLELSVLAQELNILYTQKIDEDLAIADMLKEQEENKSDDEEEIFKDRRTKKLLTDKWKIGYIKSLKAPVGFANNPTGQYNSYGNEYYYSYDGEWKEGKMHGEGVYLFRDGYTYEGYFEKGKPSGQGIAYYPDGQKYTGSWKEGRYGDGKGEIFTVSGSKYIGEFDLGRRSGTGTLTYPSGLTYTGSFYDGKPHGRGVMTSALTGWSYEGSFEDGYIRGSGVLYTPPPEKKRIVYYWSDDKENVTLPGLVRYHLKEKDEAILYKEQEKHRIYAPLRGAQLKNYVSEIRNQVIREKLQEKRDAYNKSAAKAKEDKRLLYEARMNALAGEEGT